MNSSTLNYKVLLIFAPVLILIGAVGFLIPPEFALTSNAIPYNLLHLIFGVIGLILLFIRNENFIGIFNIGFGLIDLYQALASLTGIFPVEYFRWTRIDDILHVVIGAFLVAVGLYGFLRRI